MNATLAPKPFSAFELAAGSAALAVVASIAFVGLRVGQPQNASSAAPSRFSDVAIPSSSDVTGAAGEQRGERTKKVDATRKAQPVDRGLAGDNATAAEPIDAKATGAPAVDHRWRFDDAAGVEQRLMKAGLLWRFADGIEDTDSRNAPDRPTQHEALAMSFDAKSTANRTELATQGQTATAAVEPSPLSETNSLKRIATENAFVGGWADDTRECRQGQDHGAPLVISMHAARTVSSECDFRSVTREDARRWRIVALCSRDGESWNAHVDLKLAGPNLTWSSERGTATYMRCLKP